MDIKQDNKYVMLVKTFKTHMFAISRKFDPDAVRDNLLKLQVLYNSTRLPILPNLATNFEENITRQSVFGTVAIEGNPLSESEVGEVLKKPNSENLIENAEKEVMNLKLAYQTLKEIERRDDASDYIIINEEFIKRAHRMVTMNLDDEKYSPGIYRNDLREVGDLEHGGVYQPPKIRVDIETLMESLCEWINSPQLLSINPIIRAALTHYHLGLIHPFKDGNGRTARLIEAAMLWGAGYRYAPEMLSNFYYRHKDEYFIVFRTTQISKEYDVTPFLSFMIRGLLDSIEELHSRIIQLVRHFAIKDYYRSLWDNRKITNRQFNLLLSLLALPSEFTFSLADLFQVSTLRSLYVVVNERTARRDINNLLVMKLITRKEKGIFQLDQFRLD